jgi:hypothetical protein
MFYAIWLILLVPLLLGLPFLTGWLYVRSAKQEFTNRKVPRYVYGQAGRLGKLVDLALLSVTWVIFRQDSARVWWASLDLSPNCFDGRCGFSSAIIIWCFFATAISLLVWADHKRRWYIKRAVENEQRNPTMKNTPRSDE